LQAHGHSMEMFKRSLNAPTNEFENLDLFRVTGWRE